MATDICVRLGRRIRDLRTQRGWRQIDLAAHTEMSRKHIVSLELGRTDVGLSNLERLAAAFDVTPSDLLRSIDR